MINKTANSASVGLLGGSRCPDFAENTDFVNLFSIGCRAHLRSSQFQGTKITQQDKIEAPPLLGILERRSLGIIVVGVVNVIVVRSVHVVVVAAVFGWNDNTDAVHHMVVLSGRGPLQPCTTPRAS